jgi:chemotaxis protein MotB
MGSRKKHAGHENLERWLVSYADFITLMFAVFVVLFASSQTDKGKAQRVAESVRRALEDGQFASAVAGILGGAADDKGKGNAMLKGPGGARRDSAAPPHESRQQLLSELLPSLQYLTSELKDEIGAGKLQVHMQGRGLVVSLAEAAFFQSGEDTVLPAMHPSIGKIAWVIAKLPNPVRLEGHTDSVPIHNARFRSNWDLSAARSVSMLELLASKYGLPMSRLSVAGYAENVPLADNRTEEGRSRNRRVDIVILNKLGYELEPASEQAPAATRAAGGH